MPSVAKNYILDDRDQAMVEAALMLLSKVTHSGKLNERDVEAANRIEHVLTAMPAVPFSAIAGMYVSLPLVTGTPSGTQVVHRMRVAQDGCVVSIWSGGWCDHKDIGGNFTTMSWVARPAQRAEFHSYIEALEVVPGVRPFPLAVDCLYRPSVIGHVSAYCFDGSPKVRGVADDELLAGPGSKADATTGEEAADIGDDEEDGHDWEEQEECEDGFPGETFRVLNEKEIKQFGEYRTQRLVLEAWDRVFGG